MGEVHSKVHCAGTDRPDNRCVKTPKRYCTSALCQMDRSINMDDVGESGNANAGTTCTDTVQLPAPAFASPATVSLGLLLVPIAAVGFFLARRFTKPRRKSVKELDEIVVEPSA